jgi:hypothetical protein
MSEKYSATEEIARASIGCAFLIFFFAAILGLAVKLFRVLSE